MKKPSSVLALTLFFVWAVPAGAAAPETTVPGVQDPHIQKLEEMHREAERRVAVNDFQGAIEMYREILFLEPDDETAYANMGRCHLIRGELGRAKDAFFQALDINPENETALGGLQKLRDPDAA